MRRCPGPGRRNQTSAAIKSLVGLEPKTARRMNADGTEEDVPTINVHVSDGPRVRPGEKVPVDGVVIDGSSAGLGALWLTTASRKMPSYDQRLRVKNA